MVVPRKEGERLAADLQASLGASLSTLCSRARELADVPGLPGDLAASLASLAADATAAMSVLAEAMARLARGPLPGRSGRGRGAERPGPVRLMVVDGHPVVRRGLAAAAHDDGMLLVAEVDTVADALRVARRVEPEVMLVDYRLPDMFAPEAGPLLREAAPACHLLLFTADRGRVAVDAAFAAGFEGCVRKNAPLAEVLDAIHRAAEGQPVTVTGGARRLPPGNGSPPAPPFTRREHEVLRRMALGETNTEIAEALGLSRNTVKTYVQAALRKLGARNRVEALTRAGDAGLL